MQKRSKRILAATLAAVGVAVASGVAYAAFTGNSLSNAIGGSSETITQLTITGALEDPSLWPNQSTKVTLYVDNPNTTAIKVKTITPVQVTAADVNLASPTATLADKEFCASKVQTVGANPAPDVEVGAGINDVPVEVENGIKLLGSADNKCMGMGISAKWTVNFDTAYQPAP